MNRVQLLQICCKLLLPENCDTTNSLGHNEVEVESSICGLWGRAVQFIQHVFD